MTLYFGNDTSRRPIANVGSMKEANIEIKKFLDEHNYKSYYSRVWMTDIGVKFDVGSHSQFFYLDMPQKDYDRWVHNWMEDDHEKD